jgi:vacuolar-type H+-ATPase subunit E/Vma4
MNKQRRAKLYQAINLLDNASEIIEAAVDEEQDCLDNMPENLQDSDRCAVMEDAIDCLNAAIDDIASVKDSIENAMQ